MKNILFLLVIACNLQAQAQYRFLFDRVERVPFEFLTDYDQVLPMQDVGQTVQLGFELSSYGLKGTELHLFKDYLVVFFENSIYYYFDIYPTTSMFQNWAKGKGEWHIKHQTVNGIKEVILELSGGEALGYPDETYAYRCTINENAIISMQYGPNNFSETHPVFNEENALSITELDYDKEIIDTTGEEQYLTLIQVYGNPLIPSVNYNHDPNVYENWANFPYEGCKYTFVPEATVGITEQSKKLTPVFSPNPTTGICSVKLGKTTTGVLELMDGLGRIVFKLTINQLTEVNLDLSVLPVGTYTARIIEDNKTSLLGKVNLIK